MMRGDAHGCGAGFEEAMMARRSSGAKRGGAPDQGPDLFAFADSRAPEPRAADAADPAPSPEPPPVPRPPAEPFRIALPPETFRWFAEGGRRWEVRRYGRDFIERFVYPGRAVELRRGHRPDDALTGRIASVVVAEDLAALFAQISYREVIPDAASAEEAVEIARRLLGPGGRTGIIAMEIALG
jgi:hypothetical protein